MPRSDLGHTLSRAVANSLWVLISLCIGGISARQLQPLTSTKRRSLKVGLWLHSVTLSTLRSVKQARLDGLTWDIFKYLEGTRGTNIALLGPGLSCSVIPTPNLSERRLPAEHAPKTEVPQAKLSFSSPLHGRIECGCFYTHFMRPIRRCISTQEYGWVAADSIPSNFASHLVYPRLLLSCRIPLGRRLGKAFPKPINHLLVDLLPTALALPLDHAD